jgi:hypothetical protein
MLFEEMFKRSLPKPGGVWAVIRRRRWWIYVSVFVCWAVVFVLMTNRATQKTAANRTASFETQRAESSSRGRASPDPSLAVSRFLFSVGGLFLGAAVGIASAWLLEINDKRFRAKSDLDNLLPADVLVGIPHLSTPGEQRRALLRRWFEVVALMVMLALVLYENIYIFLR